MDKKRGASFLDILTVAFIALRLSDKIDWSWVWVLAPMWVPLSMRIVYEIIKANVTKGEK